MSLLSVREVSREFGGVQALSDVSFEVESGQIFGLIGPNGAGKTTLFNVITGVYPASRGQIWFDGRQITRWGTARIALAGLTRTFQSIHLYSGLSVRENVTMGQSRVAYTGLRSLVPVLADRREQALRHAADETLEFLGLHPYASAPSEGLPYAIQRRVELARALVASPKLVLLDEPAAGCDEEESRALAADIRRIRDRGTTVVLIEHDMDVVMEVCDRIAVLNFGEKLAEGSPVDIQRDSAVVEAYLGRPDDEPTAAR